MMRVERTPGLVVHIVEARRRLEGQLTSDLLSMPHNNLLEGAIVLVEFIKVKSQNRNYTISAIIIIFP